MWVRAKREGDRGRRRDIYQVKKPGGLFSFGRSGQGVLRAELS